MEFNYNVFSKIMEWYIFENIPEDQIDIIWNNYCNERISFDNLLESLVSIGREYKKEGE